jgi:putative ABC transport system permease protein
MTWAEFGENLKVSMDTLRAHKVRSGLTLLGVVIGVTSVIAVASIIDGLNKFISDKVEKMGSRSYYVTRFPAGTDPMRMPEKIRLRKFFEYDDGRKIRDMAPAVDQLTVMGTRASFFGQSAEVRYQGKRVENLLVRGAEPAYLDVIPMFAVERGRYYTDGEEARAAAVTVIGSEVAEGLFGPADPLGKTVYINGTAYEVIGVFAQEPGLLGGPGVDQFAMVPLSNFRKHNHDVKELFIAFTIRKDVDTETGRQQVEEALRRIRKVPPNKPNDFEMISSDFLSNLWNQLTGAIVVLTSVISSIGLLVGGIGVMNIMLISVTERTREIGVRKAIGARTSDIRVQFLLEAVTLTVAGGLIGIALGAAVAWVVRVTIPSIPATVSVFWMMMGAGLSGAVGLFFGYWPADRAASLDPIVCLRYE